MQTQENIKTFWDWVKKTDFTNPITLPLEITPIYTYYTYKIREKILPVINNLDDNYKETETAILTHKILKEGKNVVKKWLHNSPYFYDIADTKVRYSVKNIVAKQKSPYQTIEILELKNFGKMLTIDNDPQLTEIDEHIYHESIVHFPISYIKHPKKCLVIGGGDGGTVRELLKYSSIQRIVLVEIDQMVLDVCKTHLPQTSAAMYADPRVEIVVNDGSTWVQNAGETFDLIIIDSTDFNQAITLFTISFYTDLQNILNENGILTFNGESWMSNKSTILDIYNKMETIFKFICIYRAHIPTYLGGEYYFFSVSDDINFNNDPNYLKFDKLKIKTKYYNTNVHNAMKALPNEVYEILNLKRNTQILGQHYLFNVNVDASHVDLLNNIDKITNILTTICGEMGLTVVGNCHKKFEPIGCSVVIILAESHITIHTWPETHLAVLDLFCCNTEIDLSNVTTLLNKYFHATQIITKNLIRTL